MTVIAIKASELAKIPYLGENGARGPIPLLPFWDGASWHLWLPQNDGTLFEMKPIDARRVEYIAKTPAAPTDFSMLFVDFMCQHANWPGVHPHYRAVLNDLHNLGTCVAKIDYFWSARDAIGHPATDFVLTELNYLLIVSRTLFDHLHEALSTIWHDHVLLVDAELQTRKKQRKLPKSFAAIVLEGKKVIRSAAQIADRFLLPPKLSEAYAEAGSFFSAVRDARDRIAHGLGQREIVYATPRGWCISPSDGFFAHFDIWNDSHRYNKSVVSLRPLIAHLVFRTAEISGMLVHAFAQDIRFPAPPAPGYQIFLRGYNEQHLLPLENIASGENIWWVDAPAANTAG
jgi:hypothetical protein